MTDQPTSPRTESALTNRIKYVLTHAREAWTRKEANKRKWDALPNGGEIHIQFVSDHELRLAIARIGLTPEGPRLTALYSELDTLIAYWPETDTRETGERKLTPRDETGRYWLVTTLTIATQLQLFPPKATP